jgi:hypothetical protein
MDRRVGEDNPVGSEQPPYSEQVRFIVGCVGETDLLLVHDFLESGAFNNSHFRFLHRLDDRIHNNGMISPDDGFPGFIRTNLFNFGMGAGGDRVDWVDSIGTASRKNDCQA